MKKTILPIILFTLLLAACGNKPASGSTPVTLNIFAAASLTDAFAEIKSAFEAENPGINITFNFGGSQTLRTQIEEGAPVDVFASANTKEMDALITGGFVDDTAPRIFLTNKLIVILPANNPAAIETLKDLAQPGIKLVLAAEEVPVGKYTRESLEKMNGLFGADFMDDVLANVVSNEDNVKQVVTKVQLGEADAGVVYTSDAVAAPELSAIEIPQEANVIALYPIAALNTSKQTQAANAFIQFVLSADGQAILQKWGFAPKP